MKNQYSSRFSSSPFCSNKFWVSTKRGMFTAFLKTMSISWNCFNNRRSLCSNTRRFIPLTKKELKWVWIQFQLRSRQLKIDGLYHSKQMECCFSLQWAAWEMVNGWTGKAWGEQRRTWPFAKTKFCWMVISMDRLWHCFMRFMGCGGGTYTATEGAI